MTMTNLAVEQETIRVSRRELKEMTRWAFVAAGCSAGEAAVAGQIVQLAEARFGCGLSAAINELEHHCFSSKPIRRYSGSVETIDDEHRRGPLIIGPLAAALAGSRGPNGGAVVVQNMSWHPVVEPILVNAMSSLRSSVTALAAWPLPVDGTPCGGDLGVIVYADSPENAPFDPATVLPSVDLRSSSAGSRTGVVFAPFSSASGPPPLRPTVRMLGEGVQVDRSDWATLCEAAKRFLVVDS